MTVTFADFGPQLASSRLRAKIPQRELRRMGMQQGNDVLVYGKHLLQEKDVSHFGALIFDICDDHFGNDLGDYYRRHIGMADFITCNSEVMKNRIKEETGREATVIPEPYEHEEKPAAIGDLLLWYGHSSNFPDLERIAGDLKYPLLALSNHPDCAEWSMESFDKAISSKCIVIIPTGKSQAKSENRMVEAIRCGRYVCAEYLPSYEPFDCFFPLGDIPEHIEQALNNPEDSIGRIRATQGYIREKYSPRTIAKQWLEVINGALNL